MDEQRFDQLSRRLAGFRTRRQALKAIAGAVVATVTGVRGTAAQACAAPYSPCQADADCCAGAVCEYGLCMPGCRIDGAFYTAWMSPPENICGQCQPEASATAWTPANEGMSCWSGDPNAGVTTCQSGVCAPVGLTGCPPPPPCYTDELIDRATCAYAFAGAGTECGNPAMCHGEVYQPADTCDGNGFCIGGGSQAALCAPYMCGQVGCTTSCDSDDDCASGAHCDDGQCFTDLDLGEPCDEDSDCQAGFCVEGICCNQRCEGLCESCSAGTGGYCSPVICDDTGVACTQRACDPASGQCVVSPRPTGYPCDDGNACTSGDFCQAGACVSGQPVVCDSENPCVIDSCDPASGCARTFKVAGSSCDDGNACDGNETCDGAGHCIEGTPVVCQPPDQCHDVGVCDPATGLCAYAPLADGTPCNDANSCTIDDTCLSGVCQGSDTDISTDPNNCGQCGYSCEAGDLCLDKQCCRFTAVGPACCPMGSTPSICTSLCGLTQCNCRMVYPCGSPDDCPAVRICDFCPQYCELPCCV